MDIFALIRNLGLDEFCQESERFLPAEIAGLGRNDIQECAIDPLRRRTEHAVKPDRVGWHELVAFRCVGYDAMISARKYLSPTNGKLAECAWKRKFERNTSKTALVITISTTGVRSA